MDIPRRLIVNADDFGLSPGINRGILEAHRHGILTSASLMVRGGAAAQAAALSRQVEGLSVGLHVDLGEWRYEEGSWRAAYQRVDLTDGPAVAVELSFQLERFRQLMGCEPSHLDSHQHVHRDEPLRSLLLEYSEMLRVPLRGFDSEVRYCGEYYGQSQKGDPYPEGISVTALVRLLTELPPGLTELGCHPGLADDLDSCYKRERAIEQRTLCDARVRAAVQSEGIALCSFTSRSMPVMELTK